MSELGQLPQVLREGMFSWYETKMFIEHASFVSSDALHLLVGTLIWLLLAVGLRRSIVAWMPWIVLAIFTVLNEVIDLSFERWPDLAMQYGESAKDVLLTMTLPTVLMLLARLRPGLFSAPGDRGRSRWRGRAGGKSR